MERWASAIVMPCVFILFMLWLMLWAVAASCSFVWYSVKYYAWRLYCEIRIRRTRFGTWMIQLPDHKREIIVELWLVALGAWIVYLFYIAGWLP